MTRPRLLHIVSARGGGMCRFARDLLATGDALLHVGGETWVLEPGSAGSPARFLPYRLPGPADEAADWLDALLAAHYGLSEEELDFVINYDIKYRMGDELDPTSRNASSGDEGEE